MPQNKPVNELTGSEQAWTLSAKGVALCNLARLLAGNESDMGDYINPALRLLDAGVVTFNAETGDLAVSQ